MVKRRSAWSSPASVQLDGLKLAVGPELWWGANPTALVKYRRKFGAYMDVTGLFQEDLARRLGRCGAELVRDPDPADAPS